MPSPPTIDVPSWVHHLSTGFPLPPEPTWRRWRDFSRENAYLLGLTTGLAIAYFAYHYVQPLFMR